VVGKGDKEASIMRVIRHPQHVHARQPSAVTVGNFDGMHVGHQMMLKQLLSVAKKRQWLSTVVLFEPHPQEFFSANKAPARLMRLQDKLTYLADMGIDQVLVLAFNARLAAVSAQNFLRDVLCQALQMRYLLVGDDFRFGHQRQGDCAYLQAQAPLLSYALSVMPVHGHEGVDRVSSSLVRKHLAQNQLAAAKQCLGRAYAMRGRVSKGQRLGTRLGYPTLNIMPHRMRCPLRGIYAVKVYGLAPDVVLGVASLGVRPVVQGTFELLEVHCFDFNAMVYGAKVTVVFCHFIRAEQDFDGLDALRHQIALDCQAAKVFFEKGEDQ
jgi:riboflavin kinase / FMN adenylyltransferase